jgi:hypothetical protein
MTVSTADLGGTGNGLGLPIANPLYGPANAAVMAQQAWNQNMDNAQATTANTRAETNRNIQTLQPDIENKQANTALTTQQAAAAKIENDAKNVLGPQRIAQGMDYDIMSKGVKSQQEAHDYVQNQVMKNADIMDGNVAAGKSADNQAMLEQWGKEAGLKPGEASTLYSGVARINAPQAPNAGPGNAANGNQPPMPGGYANFRRLLMLANPDIMKESMSQEGQNNRSAATISAEKEIAGEKIKAELESKGLELGSNNNSAYGYLRQREQEALNSGNVGMANQYRTMADDEFNHMRDLAVAQGYGRGAMSLNLPSLINGQPAQLNKDAVPPPTSTATPIPPIDGASVPNAAGGAPTPMPNQNTSSEEANITIQSIKDRPDIPMQAKAQWAQAAGWKLMTDKNGNKAFVAPNGKDHFLVQ